MDSLALTLAQINVTVGDVEGNAAKILASYARAKADGAELVIFPELAITGYPPEDMVLRQSFQKASMQAVEKLAKATARGPAMLVGSILREAGGLYNASFLLDNGKIQHIQRKSALPNYGVFDEKRVFAPGPLPQVIEWRGLRIGLLICEDVWSKEVAAHLTAQKPELILVQNASPYEMDKAKRRREVASARARAAGVPLVYVNLVGGQDELVFDGRSLIFSAAGEMTGRLAAFAEEVVTTRWAKQANAWVCEDAPRSVPLSMEETIYRAMTLGLQDYVEKNRFKGVVLGLSGGIDSALTAAVAVDALGAERVRTVMMPSPYTSQESLDDASACAKALGVALDTIPIDPGMAAMEAMLAPLFKDLPKDATEENIQARLRGNLLMAISNKFGLMVLTTGNKSEMSVGYATLYGDMCGGYSVLKDVYKTTVYKLARWRNSGRAPGALGPLGEVIPASMLTKPPSAELKPNQTDQDTLPPYETLDAILIGLVEEGLRGEDVSARGYPRAVVERVIFMLHAAEYKRRQAPPGVKITGMAFGKDWRYPITNGFKS